MGDDALELLHFHGRARLFPLPNFVMFPHVLKPLHIFEPRYRQLTEDALASDHLLALVLLRPHTPEEYAGNPPIHDTACLCRILNSQRLPDGRFNILVRGLCRLRIEAEIPSPKLYRIVQGRLLPDGPTPDDPYIYDSLAEQVRHFLPPGGQALGQIEELLAQRPPLGALLDILTFVLPLEPERKQQLLDLTDVTTRAQTLLHLLEESLPPVLPAPRERLVFPPKFSIN
jgi:Lon protease-like protein